VSRNIHFLISGKKIENITVTTCSNVAGKFLPTVLISKKFNEKEDFGDGLLPRSDVYMNSKSSYIGTKAFIKWSTEYFLKNEDSAKLILLLDGHRAHCSSLYYLRLLLKITLTSFIYGVTLLVPYAFKIRSFLVF